MKKLNISTILQLIALVFLLVIGYMTFNSSSNWKIIKSELDQAKKELQASRDTLSATKANLQKSLTELKKIQLQKGIITRQRDSLLFDFKKQNAKDWEELTALKDSIAKNNDKLNEDKVLLDRLFEIDNP
ncbi:MAG: hypothetical protein CL613_03260 [Aquimarina sp.]|nr:hypothetical protein [Aquimarina sp.]|tara:strand:- start:55 stop:444 length:390 start_codon:yes stop_codon:yes gene_type:complete